MRRFRDIGKELGELPAWNEHDELALETVAALRGLLEDACARYEARKRELAALDYLDLEVKAISLLSSYPDIAASYRARFRHLMVDELQDVNPPQIELLRLLAGGDDGARGGRSASSSAMSSRPSTASGEATFVTSPGSVARLSPPGLSARSAGRSAPTTLSWRP